jgi:hypothetical protein
LHKIQAVTPRYGDCKTRGCDSRSSTLWVDALRLPTRQEIGRCCRSAFAFYGCTQAAEPEPQETYSELAPAARPSKSLLRHSDPPGIRPLVQYVIGTQTTYFEEAVVTDSQRESVCLFERGAIKARRPANQHPCIFGTRRKPSHVPLVCHDFPPDQNCHRMRRFRLSVNPKNLNDSAIYGRACGKNKCP